MKAMTIIQYLLPLCFSCCIAPVNLSHDSARMLNKGGFEVQGALSAYSAESELCNINLGLKAGFGVADDYNVKIRYERIQGVYDVKPIHYTEFDNKFSLVKDHVAFSFPFFMYSGYWYGVDPKLYFTITDKKNFELNIVPKMHVWFGEGHGIMPGISLGLGLSENLDSWALRPEVGYDGFLSFGIGFSKYFRSKKD